MKTGYADLHLHTLFSDGTYAPEELIAQSKKAGLSAISIVDHDTISGIKPALDMAATEGIEVIPGIELTADYDGREVHILGYCLDCTTPGFKERLEELRKNRIDRIYQMLERLGKMGLSLEPDSVFKLGKGTVGRLHIARAMVEKGIVGSVAEAFSRYIGDKSSAYVCNFNLPPEKAVELIKKAGGIPVLAHPYSLGGDELLFKFIGYGIMGLEVYYPEHTSSMVRHYLAVTDKFNLLATGGSDCHGQAKPEVRIGSLKIPYSLVERIKEAKAGLERKRR
ncbi:MAG: PHP domain-containing protein [Candidatus Omnitrophota bacterium]